MRHQMTKLFMLLFLAVLPWGWVVSAQDDVVTAGTIAEQVVSAAGDADAPEFTVLLAAVQAADASIIELLGNPDASLTVFAPTDAAFEDLFEESGMSAEELLSDTALLNRVLQYHVMDGYALAADIIELESFPTILADAEVTVSTDDAGGVVLNDNVNVIVPDVLASNGVIHVIDAVLMPPAPLVAEDSILGQVIVAAGDADTPEFTILSAAIDAASGDIASLLGNADASLTVFAPTDAAFEALFASLEIDAETLLGNRVLLNRVLQYHVMDGYALAEDIVALESFPTILADAEVTVSTDDAGGVVLNDNVNVIVPDVLASNGVIHVIDAVLVPPARDVDANTILGQVVAATNDLGAPEFTILLEAIDNADPTIATLLANPDTSLTVFAPTDIAFGELLEEFDMSLDELLADTETLNTILQYHVMDGYALAADIIELESFPTLLANAEVTVSTGSDGAVFLNDDVQVILADIEVANGVIHVIDQVLLPLGN